MCSSKDRLNQWFIVIESQFRIFIKLVHFLERRNYCCLPFSKMNYNLNVKFHFLNLRWIRNISPKVKAQHFKPSKPGKPSNQPSRKNLFCLNCHYMCTTIVLARFQLKIHLTPMLLEFIKVTKRKSPFHGINTISYQSIHCSSNEEICCAKEKVHLGKPSSNLRCFQKLFRKQGVWGSDRFHTSIYFFKHHATPFKHL